MDYFYTLFLRMLMWDCDYAIQRVNSSIARQQEELREREALKARLAAEIFNREHNLQERG